MGIVICRSRNLNEKSISVDREIFIGLLSAVIERNPNSNSNGRVKNFISTDQETLVPVGMGDLELLLCRWRNPSSSWNGRDDRETLIPVGMRKLELICRSRKATKSEPKP